MKITNVLALSAAGSVVFISGCTTVYEGKYHFSQGWRKAQVVEITPGSAIQNPAFWKCLRGVSPPERHARSYIMLSYHDLGRKREHLVPLPPGTALQKGEPVYLKVDACQGAIAKMQPQ